MLCSETYGSGAAYKRNTVISLLPLPRHHPMYDNVEQEAVHLSLPPELVMAVHHHLDAFKNQGACLCAEYIEVGPRNVL
jgi:hypothetical protein